METLVKMPEVGTGATIVYAADSHAATVVAVSDNGKTVTVQRDSVRPTPGAAAYSNLWETKPDPAGAMTTFTLRRNGRYVQQGQSMKHGLVAMIGTRREYYSYEF